MIFLSLSPTLLQLQTLSTILCCMFLNIYIYTTTTSPQQAVFYLDHNYLENMLGMFRKVSAKERVVGFYSTGPAIRPNDLRIHDVVQRFTHVGLAPPSATATTTTASTGGASDAPAAADDSNASSMMMMTQPPAVFCIIDVRPDRPDLPVTAYKVVEQVNNSSGGGSSGSSSVAMKSGGSGGGGVERSFAHVPSQMGAIEAEEVGVEHLLRDINDPTISTVASLIQGKLSGLATLTEKLLECQDYLETILASQQMKSQSKNPKKAHPQILANLQTILALLPNLNQPDLVRSIMVKTNDMLASIYLASIIRSVIALHDLVNNKIRYGEDGTELMDSDDDNDEEKKIGAEKENKAKKETGDEKKKDAEKDDKKDAKKK
jgi:26S proteasome regulatory subunit N8